MTRLGWTPEERSQVSSFLRSDVRRRLMIARVRARTAVQPHGASEDPILLLGCPRSGTTLLFDLLQQHEGLVSLDEEGHVYWSAYHHPRRGGWRSDEVCAEDLLSRERKYVDTAFAMLGNGRPLDKTPKNVLRIAYLRALYPRARIVLAVRDGRATVASLLEGWRKRRGASYLLPTRLRLSDYDSRIWRYVLPPGWEKLQGTDLPTVATRQYLASSSAALQHRDLIDAVVRYEELVDSPVETMRALLKQLSLSPSAAVEQAAAHLDEHDRGAISAPRRDKWRAVEADLTPHRAAIEVQMRQWGYVV